MSDICPQGEGKEKYQASKWKAKWQQSGYVIWGDG